LAGLWLDWARGLPATLRDADGLALVRALLLLHLTPTEHARAFGPAGLLGEVLAANTVLSLLHDGATESDGTAAGEERAAPGPGAARPERVSLRHASTVRQVLHWLLRLQEAAD